MFGAGGSARSIIYALNKMESNITVINRTAEKVELISKDLDIPLKIKSYKEINNIISDIDLIVNTTSLGMKDNHSTRGYFSSNIADSLLDKIEVPLLIAPNDMTYNVPSTIVYATDFEQEDISSIKKIIASWLVTIPAGAAFTVLFYVLLRIIFGV